MKKLILLAILLVCCRNEQPEPVDISVSEPVKHTLDTAGFIPLPEEWKHRAIVITDFVSNDIRFYGCQKVYPMAILRGAYGTVVSRTEMNGHEYLQTILEPKDGVCTLFAHKGDCRFCGEVDRE